LTLNPENRLTIPEEGLIQQFDVILITPAPGIRVSRTGIKGKELTYNNSMPRIYDVRNCRPYDVRNWTDALLLSAVEQYACREVDEEIQRRKSSGIWKVTKEL
jgi:hypothetical protein